MRARYMYFMCSVDSNSHIYFILDIAMLYVISCYILPLYHIDGIIKESRNNCSENIILRLKQNCRHFTDGILTYIFLYGNVWISLKIWLKFDPKVLIDSIPGLVQIMAWRRPSHHLNQWWFDYWRISASLGLNELKRLLEHQNKKLYFQLAIHATWYLWLRARLL